MIPAIPSWSGIHPLVVHFPIALLLVAPLFVVLSLVLPNLRQGMAASAMTLMTLGLIGVFVAVASGGAAAELAERTPAITNAIEEHKELAEKTRIVFCVLILAYAALLAFPLWKKVSLPRRTDLALHTVFLAAYLGAMLLLANTADRGGHLVHFYGVHALLPVEKSQGGDK